MDIGYEADPKYDSGFRYCGTSCYDTGKRSNFKRGAYTYMTSASVREEGTK